MQRELALYSRAEPGGTRAGLAVSLEEREELLAEAERIAHLGTWLWNVEDDAVYWSEELFRLLGYDPVHELASTEAFFAAVHPDDRERVRAASSAAITSGIARQVDCRVLTRDGTLRYITMDAAFLFDDQGRLRRVLGTALDITHIRSLQEKLAQAEKMEAIGRLAAGVAHDFNNVLTVVRGNLDLQNLPASHEMKQVVSALESAADLTSKLLTLGRRSPLRRRTVDLSVLATKTVALVERMLREQVMLRVQVPDHALLVDVDETLIEQALVNLLLNARDALPQGGNVEVAARALEEAGRSYVELLVSDDGPGMSEATQTRVFEPFFSTKEDSSRHGLGLAMVHGTVAQHGGTVVVESSHGHGTRFRLRFPRIDVPAPPQPRVQAPPSEPRTPSCSVLLVEDQEIVGATIRRLLEHLGHQVQFATTPSAALAMVMHSSFDVILCDVMMPEMRGPALIDKIRLIAPHTAKCVIYMTGNSADVVDIDAELLSKPFTIHQLKAALSRACAGRERMPVLT